MGEDQEEHPRVGDIYVWSENGVPEGEEGVLALVTRVRGEKVWILWRDPIRNSKWTETWFRKRFFSEVNSWAQYVRVRVEGEK